MPESGLNLVLVLRFDSTMAEGARVLLWQDGTHVQDDPLTEIRLIGDSLRFTIKPKSTRFEGRVNTGRTKITGTFTFPDGSLHTVDVDRIDWPTLMARDSEETAERWIAVDNLRRDLDVLFTSIVEIHPNPFGFVARETLEARFSKAKTTIKDPLSPLEFLAIAARLTASIGCAHTDVRLPERVSAELRSRPGYLPVRLGWHKGIVRVIEPGSYIPVGSRIVSIRGIGTDSLAKTLLATIPRDGSNETYRRFVLNRDFAERYAVAHGLSRSFDIEYVDPEGKRGVVTLEGTPLREKEVLEPPLSFRIDDDAEAAILTVRAFMDTEEERFVDFISKTFRSLKEAVVPRLIIDLRGNTGGYPLHAAFLLSYLAEKHFVYFADDADPVAEFASLYRPMEPNVEQFRGSLAVLVDGANISTAGHFVSLVRFHKLGELIGEETGGTYWANGSGRVITLPNSRLEVNIPQRMFRTAVVGLRRDRGIEPDILVESGLPGEVGQTDAVLSAALLW